MSNSPAPTNYEWIGNTLTYDLNSSVTGVKLKYKKQGDSEWTVILDSPNSAPVSCTLNSSNGPSGTICGVTQEEGATGGGWGTEVCNPITNI